MYTTFIFNVEEEKFINALLNQAIWPHHQQPDDLPYRWVRMEPLKPWVAPRACHPLTKEEPTRSVAAAFNTGGGI
jgi:hypothetical protein